MLNKKMFRLTSLVLALGLLLSLVITGCSNNDNGVGGNESSSSPSPSPSSSPDPTPTPPSSGGLLYYHFSLERPLAKGIYGMPTHIVVSATDANNNEVEVTTMPDPVYIPDMDLDDEGYYVIETIYGEGTTNVVFTFTHEEGGQSILDDQRVVDVAKLDVVDDVYADAKEVENEVNVETFDQEGNPALVFKTRTDFYARVWFGPKGSQVNVSSLSNVKLLSGSKAVTVTGYDANAQAFACRAVSKGDSVKLSVDIDGFVAKDVASIRLQSDPIRLYYVLEDLQREIYLAEDGHIMRWGEYLTRIDDIGDVEGYDGIAETLDLKYTVVIHYSEDENGYPLFTTVGVPNFADVIVENVEEDPNLTFTGKYEYPIMTVHSEKVPGSRAGAICMAYLDVNPEDYVTEKPYILLADGT